MSTFKNMGNTNKVRNGWWRHNLAITKNGGIQTRTHSWAVLASARACVRLFASAKSIEKAPASDRWASAEPVAAAASALRPIVPSTLACKT